MATASHRENEECGLGQGGFVLRAHRLYAVSQAEMTELRVGAEIVTAVLELCLLKPLPTYH